LGLTKRKKEEKEKTRMVLGRFWHTRRTLLGLRSMGPRGKVEKKRGGGKERGGFSVGTYHKKGKA